MGKHMLPQAPYLTCRLRCKYEHYTTNTVLLYHDAFIYDTPVRSFVRSFHSSATRSNEEIGFPRAEQKAGWGLLYSTVQYKYSFHQCMIQQQPNLRMRRVSVLNDRMSLYEHQIFSQSIASEASEASSESTDSRFREYITTITT